MSSPAGILARHSNARDTLVINSVAKRKIASTQKTISREFAPNKRQRDSKNPEKSKTPNHHFKISSTKKNHPVKANLMDGVVSKPSHGCLRSMQSLFSITRRWRIVILHSNMQRLTSLVVYAKKRIRQKIIRKRIRSKSRWFAAKRAGHQEKFSRGAVS